MLRMSFLNGTFQRDQAISFIEGSDKPIKYTVGFKWRSPEILNVSISKEDALEVVKNNKLIDVDEMEDHVDINVYSESDMW